jgi:hypothetical protein
MPIKIRPIPMPGTTPAHAPPTLLAGCFVVVTHGVEGSLLVSFESLRGNCLSIFVADRLAVLPLWSDYTGKSAYFPGYFRMLTRSIISLTLKVTGETAMIRVEPLAEIDWTAIGLWAVACLTAVSLLAGAINRRRKALTEALKKHVVDTIGTIDAEEQGEKSE